MMLFFSVIRSFVMVSSVAALAACAEDMAIRKVDGILVTASGMTVYTYDPDTNGKSVCNNRCAINWPPVIPLGTPGGVFSVITRDDGSAQLAFKGKPLYLFIGDHEAGDREGDDVGDVWHIVKN